MSVPLHDRKESRPCKELDVTDSSYRDGKVFGCIEDALEGCFESVKHEHN